MSHDFEDIVAVIDGRAELSDEIKSSDIELKTYLGKIFLELLKDNNFSACLPGHLNYGPATLARTKMVLTRIKQIADISD